MLRPPYLGAAEWPAVAASCRAVIGQQIITRANLSAVELQALGTCNVEADAQACAAQLAQHAQPLGSVSAACASRPLFAAVTVAASMLPVAALVLHV